MTDESKYTPTERLLAGAGIVTFGIGVFFVTYFDPSKRSFFPGCPLLEHTGFACPGCGLTRGFHALFHGDLYTALDFNLLVPVFALGFAWMLALLFNTSVRGKRLTFAIISPLVVWIFISILAIFGVLRNLPFEPFKFLFP